MPVTDGQAVRYPFVEKRLLNPIERIAEILFGLIMALSFTCALSVTETDRVEIRQMLFGALGCNIAWGIIDAVLFLMITIAQRGRDLTILNYIRNSAEEKKCHNLIAETLSPEIATAIGDPGLEKIRKEIVAQTHISTRPRFVCNDWKTALGIFLLVFLSTFPIAIPFALFRDVHLALRISNGIAIILLFAGGWILARYSSYHKFRTGLYLALIGAGMVFLTISLGG